MNIAPVAVAPAPAAPAAPSTTSPSASDTGEPAPFARLLHAAAGPKEGARPGAKPAAKPDAKHDAKAPTKADATAEPANAARGAGAVPVLPTAANAATSDVQTATEDASDDDTEARTGAEGDASALIASLLGATPRPLPAAPAATSAAGKGAAEAAASATAPAGRAARDLDTARGALADAADHPGAGHEAAAPAPAATLPDAPAFMLPALQGAGAAAVPPPAADAPTTGADPRIAAPVHSPEFAPALGAQVSLLLKDGVQEARLQLNPAELGPITVQIQLDGQNAQVTMSAEQAVTRERLEQALPALAGALQDNGLTLTGGGVFEQPRQSQQGAAAGPPGRRPDAGEVEADEPAALAMAVRRNVLPGGVDLYA